MISFTEYLESKNALFQAMSNVSLVDEIRQVTKYVKIPLFIDGLEVTTSLKPGDVLQLVKYVPQDTQSVILTLRIISDRHDSDIRYRPKWSNDKMIRWVEHNSTPAALPQNDETFDTNLLEDI